MSAPRKRARISGPVHRGPKRDNEDGGGAAFEVPELPADFDGIPLDGGQYLAMVRQEARRHAPVYRLGPDHPYMKQTLAPSRAIKEQSPAAVQGTLARDMPVPQDGAWHKIYTAKFRNLRDRISASLPPSSSAVKRRIALAQAELPEDPNNEGLWFAWLHGFRMRDKDKDLASAPVPGARAQVRRPTMVYLAALEHADKLFLLEAMTDWIALPAAQDEVLLARLGQEAILPFWASTSTWGEEEAGKGLAEPESEPEPEPVRRVIPTHLAVWMFAILASLSPHLDSDETSMLRQLVRALGQAIKSSRQRTLRTLRLEEDEGVELEGNEDEIALLGPSAGASAATVTRTTTSQAQVAGAAREAILAQARATEGCAWMIIASIIDVWRQTDLWDEIRSTLAEL